MIGFILKHPIAVGVSVLLHVILALLITIEWSESSEVIKVASQGDNTEVIDVHRIEPLKTFAVDASLVQQQLEKVRTQEAAKKQESQQLVAKTQQERERLKELQERQKIEQEKAEKARNLADQQRKKTELERQKTEEAKRLAKLEKSKADAEKAKAEEAKKAAELAEKERLKSIEKSKQAEKTRLLEEKKKLALEKENAAKAKENEALKKAQEKAKAAATLQRQLDEEVSAQRKAQKRKQLVSLKESYVSAISAKIRDNWRTPARVSLKAECDLQIIQTPAGNVTSVKILNCNEFANKQFKVAAEKAVYRSEPLPKPPVKELFEREITLNFKP
ncbi:MAG: cell envelope integrity protein TolA [Thiomicrorhabdus sp.]|nr:cell envelope integrity protein TolA [Thiomicrorhabdus sp.]